MSDSVIHALAGSIGGCISMAMTYPLVNLSTRAAVQTKREHVSTKEALVKIIKEEGVSGIYSGLGSSLFGIAVTNGIYYAFYEEMRSMMIRRRTKTPTSTSALSMKEGIVAGLIAGSITTLATNPIWTVQTAQATQASTVAVSQGETKRGKSSAVQVIKEIINREGPKGLWRGIGPALVLVLNPVIQYTTFERLVSLLLGYRIVSRGITPTGTKSLGRSSLSDWDLFMLGAVSKLIATSSTYPYIVVKSRLVCCYYFCVLQVCKLMTKQQAATHKYKSSIQAVLHILKTESVSGLYAGLSLKLLQSVLTAAFMFVAQRRIYEFVKKVLVMPISTHMIES
nr:solute carrier family 25 (peroxisomal adenine nucleotide transporter), member 17 [Cryptococcus depauperatus CBS 7841]